jgi:YebC/PmpR family DNA-binding regulatory protein
MAGHSHWANIQHKKGATDAKRGKLWSKLSRAIIIAARHGGGDPTMNLKLRYAIDKAREVSMPKDNIERAIKRGTGELAGDVMEELSYEGFGPGGVAIFVDSLTDNRNRTNGEVRKIFERGGGNMGGPGCVGYLFDRKGIIVVESKSTTEDALMNLVLETGADDMSPVGDDFEILCEPTVFNQVQEALQKAGVDFACLATEETCNGDSARRLGNEYLYQAMAQAAVEQMNGYKVRKVLTNCPHCFNTIKNEFTQFGGNFEVIHAAEFLQQLIAQGRLQVPAEFQKRVAYHDSCYYGRFNDVYDEPRDVLTKAGANLQEMTRHKHFGMCCGAGGGRMWIEEDPDKRVNLLRTDQALETNPEVIAVSCPFCMTMLSDGIKAKDLEERVQTLDVVEIVDRVVK